MRHPKPNAETPAVPQPDGLSGPEPIQVLCGPTLCRVRVWSEAFWAELPPSRRPARAVLAPGLGWVVAVPEVVIN